MNHTTVLSLWSKAQALCACLALLLVAPLVFAQDANPRTLIANVLVVGTRTIPNDKVMAYINTKPGREYTHAEVQKDVARLAESRLFKYMRVRTESTTDGRLNVIFEVQEHPNIVRDVVYKHAKHVNVKDLEGMTKLRRGMPLDKSLNQLACYTIQDHLKKQGYYHAWVTLEKGFDETHDEVVFRITEGPRVRVRETRFVGQKELADAARLRTQIDTSRAFLQSFGGVFQPEMVDHDVTKLIEYYRNNGYLNVHVERRLDFSDDFQFVDITFHIQEGVRHRISDYSVEAPKEFSREQWNSIVTVKKGDYYNENVVNADVRNLTDFGGWRGYPLEVKKVVTELPDNPGLVRVQYVVEDRPQQTYVGEVIIVGNEVTKDRVIRRVLGLYPGQVLRYPELRIAERDLQRLNIFKNKPEEGIRPTITVLDNPSPFKDILVKVEDDRTGQFMIGAGINSNSGLVGNIVLNERNFDIFRWPTSFSDFYEGKAFRGAGQEFRIEAVPGTQVQRYTISLREPFLFDRPYSLLTSLYYRDRIFNEYTEGRLGTRVSLGHQLTKEWGVSAGMRLEDVNVSNIAYGAPPDYTDAYGHSTLAAPSVSLFWDTRDSFLRPTEGARAELSYEQAFGSYTFPIFNIEASRYFTLWQRPDSSGRHVLALRTQASFAGDSTPVYERFFGGGYNSIRGFQFRGVGPNTNGFMVGGQFQFLNSIEYQVPIRANDNLYFVTFIDSGTVESKIGIQDYRVSAGFGLRINVPMLGPVPIALDFGFPIVHPQSDQTQMFSFWIGMNR